MKMKAGVYYGPGDIRVEMVDRPKAGPEGMVMKVGSCGICPVIDIAHYKMSFPLKDIPPHYQPDPLPSTSKIIMGHEFSGEVVDVGSKVTAVAPGDRLYGATWSPCGRCDVCKAGHPEDCIFIDGAGRIIDGAFAEYILFPNLTYPSVISDKIIKLPEGMSFREGAFLEPMRLSMGLAHKANPGDVVVVFGQELIGLATVARLKEIGASKVIACDVSKKRLQCSLDLGADMAIDVLHESVFDAVMGATSGKGADVVIEAASGRPESLQEAVTVVKNFGDVWLGTFYTAGPFFDPSWQSRGMVSMNITQKPGVSIRCAWGTLGPWLPNLRLASEMIMSGKITAGKIVTQVFPLDNIREAFETAVHSNDAIKIMIEP